MSDRSKTVRVFVSSTFRDMHAERDQLVAVVFPELRERCERLGFEFFDVDLRWGVPEKTVDGETANSWEYCRQWIDRVQPLFVCLLGQRYGWVPPAESLKEPAAQAAQRKQPRSITDMEVAHALRQDGQMRRTFFYLRSTEAAPDAGDYVDPEPLQTRLKELKHALHECGRPVRSYDCQWSGKGFTGLERFGQLVLDDLWSGVLRDPRYVSQEIWQQALGADPSRDSRYTDDTAPVPADLAERIVALARPAPVSPLELERQQMAAFATARLRWFQGRHAELAQLTEFVEANEADAPRLAIVAAVPGQGKSALLAQLSRSLAARADRTASPAEQAGSPAPRTSGHAVEPPLVLVHFVGATESSASVHALVQRLLLELDEAGIVWPDEASAETASHDFNSLCVRLAHRLAGYAGPRRIVLLIDALNQLMTGHDLRWLPRRLGEGVRVIVSCVTDPTAAAGTPEQAVVAALAERQPESRWIRLGPLAPGEIRTIVIEYLKEYCKELDALHVELLCRLPQASNPLYLLVALGELRTLGGNDLNRQIPQLIATLPERFPDTTALFTWVLERLEVFGRAELQYWCLYLLSGRVGMASRELTELLGRKLGPAAAGKAPLIERGLRRYLQRRGAQLDFFHTQARQAAWNRYGPGADPAALHRDLAAYFHAQPTWAAQPAPAAWPAKPVPHARKVSELAYHQWCGGLAADYHETLTTPEFLDAKCIAWGPHPLLQDFALGTTAGGPAAELLTAPQRHTLAALADAVRVSSHVLHRDRDELPTQLYGRLPASHTKEIARFRSTLEQTTQRVWFKPLTPLRGAQPGLVRTLSGHRERIQALFFVSDDARLLSVSTDHTCVLWDLSSGSPLYTVSFAPLGILAAAVSEAHRMLALGLSDARIVLLDLATGIQRLEFPIADAPIRALALGQEQRRLAWASDRGITVADWSSRSTLWSASARDAQISSLVFTEHDAQLVSAGADASIEFWDAARGIAERRLRCQAKPITGLAASRDGQWIASRATDREVFVFDGSAEPIRIPPLEAPTCIAVGRAGRFVLYGDWDGAIHHHALDLERAPRTLTAHRLGLSALALGESDDHLASGADDGAIVIWNRPFAGPAVDDVPRGLVRCVTIERAGRVAFFEQANGRDPTRHYTPVALDELRVVLERMSRQLGAFDVHGVELPDGREWAPLPHEGMLTALALAPSGRRLFSVMMQSTDVSLCIWDVRTQTRVDQLALSQSRIDVLLVANDERHVITGSIEGHLQIWDLARKARIFHHALGRNISTGALAPNQSLIALGYEDHNTIDLFDLVAGRVVRTLQGHRGEVRALAFSPDNRYLLSGSADQTVAMWRCDDWDRVATFRCHHGQISAIALTPDLRGVLTASRDGHVQLSTFPDGRPVCAFLVDDQLNGLAFAPLSGAVIAGTDNSSFLLMQVVGPGGAPMVAGATLWTTRADSPENASAWCPGCGHVNPLDRTTAAAETSCACCGRRLRWPPITCRLETLALTVLVLHAPEDGKLAGVLAEELRRYGIVTRSCYEGAAGNRLLVGAARQAAETGLDAVLVLFSSAARSQRSLWQLAGRVTAGGCPLFQITLDRCLFLRGWRRIPRRELYDLTAGTVHRSDFREIADRLKRLVARRRPPTAPESSAPTSHPQQPNPNSSS